LLALAAMWGGSFIFTRAVAPELGALPTAWARATFGGLFLVACFTAMGLDLGWRGNWRRLAIIALLNSVLPFSLYAFAALYLPASYSAIFYSSTSLFGAAFAALWLDDTMTMRKAVGLLTGLGGVALVAGVGGLETSANVFLAITACVGAAMSYAVVAVYVSKFARDIDSRALAGPSQCLAGLMLLPLLAFDPPQTVDAKIVLNLAGLALLSSGIAYLLFFRLLTDVGPSKALTVTFLVPAFAMLWGAVFLGESITLTMLAGTLAIVAGTLLVTGRVPSGSAWWRPRRVAGAPSGRTQA
jgi:drug/metabolite transporter (DMT)-like permease